MERLFIVSYNIDNDGVRDGFEKYLRDLPKWCRYISNTWLVVTELTPDEIIDAVRYFLAGTDRVIVMPVVLAGPHQGWLPEDGWKWINETKAELVEKARSKHPVLPSPR